MLKFIGILIRFLMELLIVCIIGASGYFIFEMLSYYLTDIYILLDTNINKDMEYIANILTYTISILFVYLVFGNLLNVIFSKRKK